MNNTSNPLLVSLPISNMPLREIEAQPVTMPEWTPVHDDRALIPAPERQVERVIERVIRDGDMVIHEREIIYLKYPNPEPEPDPDPGIIYTIPTRMVPNPPSIAEQLEMIADWKAGKLVFAGGPMMPEEAIRSQLQRPHVENGRIVLGE